MNICIIGKGSIGTRHAKIFKSLGCNIFFLRSEKKMLDYANEVNSTKKFNKKISLYCICNPSSKHFKSFKDIASHKANIFIEKPLVTNLKDLKNIKKLIKKHKINLFNGYMLRKDPRINLIKEKIKKEKIRYSNFVWQTFMPKWHNKENFKKSYASQKKLGGGVLLTCAHEIDLAVYLFGKVQEVLCVENNSTTKIDVDSSVHIILKHNNKINSNITLDFLSNHKAKREFEITCENKNFKWNFYQPYIEQRIENKLKKMQPKKNSGIDRIYYYQNLEIIRKIKKKAKSLEEIGYTEQVILAAKKSILKKKFIKV